MDDAAKNLFADTVAKLERGGAPVADAERAAALALGIDMIEAAEKHGFTYEDFRWVGSLPAECLDVVLARRDRAAR